MDHFVRRGDIRSTSSSQPSGDIICYLCGHSVSSREHERDQELELPLLADQSTASTSMLLKISHYWPATASVV